VSGRASSAAHDGVSAHSLTWIDSVSGEGLRLEMSCDEAFAQGLESTGFVRVARIGTQSANQEHAQMDTKDDASPAEREYAEAHTLHYETRDQARALRAYERLIAQHPRTPEAGYARAQIENIANQVVPAEELLAAKLELALRFVQPLPATPAPVGA